MFFSIIIPSYNPKKFIKQLMESIRNSYCYRGDIEVIFSDDQSTEDFEEDLKPYMSDMDIKIIKNDKHYGYPRWGRQHGLEKAQGKWICFCDQDDIFLPNAFDQMKQLIEKNNLHDYLVTNFYLCPPGVTEIDKMKRMEQTLNWTHGKFYELSFLRDNNVHYDELRYCEDINFSSHVDLALRKIKKDIIFIDVYTYIWHKREDSLSNNIGYKDYFFKSFPEYIDGTVGVYIEDYEKNLNCSNELAEYYQLRIEQTFLYYYFYFQGLINPVHECPPIPDSYYQQIADYYFRYLKCIRKTSDEFIENTYQYKIDLYTVTRATATAQIPFIEYEGYGEWIKNRLVPYGK